MARVVETHLQPVPMKTVTTPNAIELWVKRPGTDWKMVVAIKAAKNNRQSPWSVRYHEFGTAKYCKFATWEEVKKDILQYFFVEIPDDVGERLQAKIMALKMAN